MTSRAAIPALQALNLARGRGILPVRKASPCPGAARPFRRAVAFADLTRWTALIYLQRLPTWLALTTLVLIPLAVFNVLVDSWQMGMVDSEKLTQAFTLPPDQNPLFTDPALQMQIVQVFVTETGTQLFKLLVQSIVLSGAGAVLAAAAFRGRQASLIEGLHAALGSRLVALAAGHGSRWALIALIVATC
jgi:hypothetical protein